MEAGHEEWQPRTPAQTVYSHAIVGAVRRRRSGRGTGLRWIRRSAALENVFRDAARRPQGVGPDCRSRSAAANFDLSMRPIRVLVAKPGLDGHDRGAKVVAAALRDAGMEVIYTGLHQTPEMIATAAIQEDVDVIGLSILSGAHMTLIPSVQDLVHAQGRDDILITGGGIIPKEDVDTLERRGIGRLFGPGTPTTELIAYIKEWFATREKQEA